jgi:hypothetical protein
MSLIILNLEEAKAAYRALCAEVFIDEAVDDSVSTLIAKQFDGRIDDLLEEWIPVLNGTQTIEDMCVYLCDGEDVSTADVAVHELLYEVHRNYSHLGIIIRVVLLDHLGNLIAQTEDLTDANYNFRLNR